MMKRNSLRPAMARKASMRKSSMAQSQKAKSGTRTPPAPKADQSRAAQMQAQQVLDAQKRAKAAAGSKSRFTSKQEEALKKYNSKTSSSPVRATPRPMKEAPPKPKSGTTKPMGRSLFSSNAAKTLRGKK